MINFKLDHWLFRVNSERFLSVDDQEKVLGVSGDDLMSGPVFDFDDQQPQDFTENRKIRLFPLYTEAGLVADPLIRLRSGRFPEETKDLPFALGGALLAFDILGLQAEHIYSIPRIQERLWFHKFTQQLHPVL